MSPTALLRRLLTARVRFALCVMVGAYPLITLILIALAPVTGDWPVALKTLVVVPMMVSGMVFGVIPLVHRWAGPWIAAASLSTEAA
jgi:antibiotic biosynthesis monooxygenase (ABM) superfamily enzyme